MGRLHHGPGSGSVVRCVRAPGSGRHEPREASCRSNRLSRLCHYTRMIRTRSISYRFWRCRPPRHRATSGIRADSPVSKTIPDGRLQHSISNHRSWTIRLPGGSTAFVADTRHTSKARHGVAPEIDPDPDRVPYAPWKRLHTFWLSTSGPPARRWRSSPIGVRSSRRPQHRLTSSSSNAEVPSRILIRGGVRSPTRCDGPLQHHRQSRSQRSP